MEILLEECLVLVTIVTGSHTDTVATAGKYDGVLGVLAGLEAARELKGKISSRLEVVIFHDEENTMSGSIGYCSKNQTSKHFLNCMLNRDQF